MRLETELPALTENFKRHFVIMSPFVFGKVIPGTALNGCSGNWDYVNQLKVKLLESVMW